jgi:hypothetical protein
VRRCIASTIEGTCLLIARPPGTPEFCDVRSEIEDGAVEPNAHGAAARPARVAPGGSDEEIVALRTPERGA